MRLLLAVGNRGEVLSLVHVGTSLTDIPAKTSRIRSADKKKKKKKYK